MFDFELLCTQTLGFIQFQISLIEIKVYNWSSALCERPSTSMAAKLFHNKNNSNGQWLLVIGVFVVGDVCSELFKNIFHFGLGDIKNVRQGLI